LQQVANRRQGEILAAFFVTFSDTVTSYTQVTKMRWKAVEKDPTVLEALITRFTRVHKIPSASAGGIFFMYPF
jgi:hypothetical protein